MLEKLWQKSLGLYVYKIKYTDSARRDISILSRFAKLDILHLTFLTLTINN